MPAILGRADHRRLSRDLNEAACIVHNGHVAWQQGVFGQENIAGLLHAQITLAQHLAEHEDKCLVLCEETLGLMRSYEQMAADLLQGINDLHHQRCQEWVRVEGRYSVTRKLTIGGKPYQYVVGCTNPAVGALELDEWEHELRRSLEIMEQAA